MIRTLAVAVSTMVLAGCVSLLPEPGEPPRIFTIRADTPAAGAAMPLSQTAPVSVAIPEMERAVSGAEIAWRSGGELRFLPAAGWSARSADLLRSLLVEQLNAAGVTAVRPGDGSAPGFVLNWSLTAFEIVEGAGPLSAVCSGTARLVRTTDRTIAGQITFSETSTLADRGVTASAEALGRAANACASRIAEHARGVLAAPAPLSAGRS